MATDRRQALSAPPLWRRLVVCLTLSGLLVVICGGLLWHRLEDVHGPGPLHYVPPQATLVVSLHPLRLLCDNALSGGVEGVASMAGVGLGYLTGKPLPVAASFRGRLYLYRLPSEPGVWFVTYRGPGGPGPISRMLRPLAGELLGPAQVASSRFYVLPTATPGVHVAAFAPFWMRQTALARLTQVSRAPGVPSREIVASVAHGGHLTLYMPLTSGCFDELTSSDTPSLEAMAPQGDLALDSLPLPDDGSLEAIARRAVRLPGPTGPIVAHLHGRLLFFPGRIWGQGAVIPAKGRHALDSALWPALAPGLDEPRDTRPWVASSSRGPAGGGIRWPQSLSALAPTGRVGHTGYRPAPHALLTDYVVAHPAVGFREGWLARQKLYRNGRALARVVGLDPDGWLACLGPEVSLERVVVGPTPWPAPLHRPIVSVGHHRQSIPYPTHPQPDRAAAPEQGWQLSMPIREVKGAVAGVARLRAQGFLKGVYPRYRLSMPSGELLCSDERLTLTTLPRATALDYRRSDRAGVVASLGPEALRSLITPTGLGANPYVAHLCDHLDYLHVEGRPIVPHKASPSAQGPCRQVPQGSLEIRLRLEHSLDVFALGQLMASP